MDYRTQIIAAINHMLEAEQILFTSALNIAMAGELSHLDEGYDENDLLEFNLHLLKSVEDVNVKNIVEIIEALNKNINTTININKISENELGREFN